MPRESEGASSPFGSSTRRRSSRVTAASTSARNATIASRPSKRVRTGRKLDLTASTQEVLHHAAELGVGLVLHAARGVVSNSSMLRGDGGQRVRARAARRPRRAAVICTSSSVRFELEPELARALLERLLEPALLASPRAAASWPAPA